MVSSPCSESSTPQHATWTRQVVVRGLSRYTWNRGTPISWTFWNSVSTKVTKKPGVAISSPRCGFLTCSWNGSKKVGNGHSSVRTRLPVSRTASVTHSRRCIPSTKKRVSPTRPFQLLTSGKPFWRVKPRLERPTCSTRMPVTPRVTRRTWGSLRVPICVSHPRLRFSPVKDNRLFQNSRIKKSKSGTAKSFQKSPFIRQARTRNFSRSTRVKVSRFDAPLTTSSGSSDMIHPSKRNISKKIWKLLNTLSP